MKYSLDIPKQNERAHADIEQDIAYKQDGLFTFILRVNNGVVVDYNVLDYVTYAKYDGLEKAIIEEFTASHNHQPGSSGDTLRTNNSQRRA